MSALIWWVILLSLLGALAGWLFWHTPVGMGAGLVAGAFAGVWTALSKVSRLVFPDSFVPYAYDSPVVESKSTSRYLDIKIWTSPTSSSWLRLGLTDEEWRRMAEAIHKAQAFSTDVLERKLYGKVKQRFLDTGLIVPDKAGFALTRDGKNFFKYLATTPFPYENVPELIQLLDES